MLKNRFVRIALIILLTVFLVHQIYSAVYSPITTESAQFVTETDGISFTGMIIRNEIVIDKSSSGVMHLRVSDGERVAKNGTIADIYSKERDSLTVSEIEEIKKKISDIETIQSYNDLAAVDINLLDSKITNTLGNMLFLSANGNFSSSREGEFELLTMMNRKEMVIGNNTDYTQQLTDLEDKLSSLEDSLSEPMNKITAVSSGFFVSQVDGYEMVLSADNLDRYTPEFMDTLIPEQSNTKGKIGKIVSDYTWYIAADMTANQSLSYKAGDNVIIKTQLKSNPYINVVVEQINLSDDRERAVILFSCQEMNAELATMRTGAMTVINGQYEGLKIDKGALRVNDNQTGVYIISGMELKFVTVKVLYQTEYYVICQKADASENTELRLYDKVVVRGKNLYDGKIIN